MDVYKKSIGALLMGVCVSVGVFSVYTLFPSPFVSREGGDLPEIHSTVYGEVAPGDIYTTIVNQNAYEDFLPTSTPAIVVLSETGKLVSAREVKNIAIDYRKYPDGSTTLGRFPNEPRIKSGVWAWQDKAGNKIRDFVVKDNINTDDHGILRLRSGNFLLPSYKFHTLPDGREVQSFLLEEQTPTGEVVFVWDSIDHVPLSEYNAVESRPYWVEQDILDYVHGNSIAEANDGNLLISGRHINQILKIDKKSGAVMWRLGGKSSDFAFLDDPQDGFSHQHSVTQLPNGNILLYDNGNQHDPRVTRVVEYELDQVKGIARLVWSYSDGRFTFATGSVQRLQNGNTLIGWGMELNGMSSTTPRIVEVTPNREVVLEVYFPDNAGFYSAYKL